MAIIEARFWKNKIILFCIAVSLVSEALLLWIFQKLPQNQETLFLHYNIYFGIDLIGPLKSAYLYFPVTSGVIFLFNTFFAYFLFSREKILSIFFEVTAALSSVIFLVAGVFMVRLNFT